LLDSLLQETYKRVINIFVYLKLAEVGWLKLTGNRISLAFD